MTTQVCRRLKHIGRVFQRLCGRIIHAVKTDDFFAIIEGNHHQRMNPLTLHISCYVVPRDQERLRAMTKKRIRMVRSAYILGGQPSGTENTAIFAQRDVNAVVEQEEKYKLEARQSLEDILEGSGTPPQRT